MKKVIALIGALLVMGALALVTMAASPPRSLNASKQNALAFEKAQVTLSVDRTAIRTKVGSILVVNEEFASGKNRGTPGLDVALLTQTFTKAHENAGGERQKRPFDLAVLNRQAAPLSVDESDMRGTTTTGGRRTQASKKV